MNIFASARKEHAETNVRDVPIVLNRMVLYHIKYGVQFYIGVSYSWISINREIILEINKTPFTPGVISLKLSMAEHRSII